ncbi:MAG: 2-dehydro-3-deoxygalactonokinase [Gammaproteobacteria bacterium]
MPEPSFLAGDWGTSHLRLLLCDANGVVLDSRHGPGAAEIRGHEPAAHDAARVAARRYTETFAALTARWEADFGALPAVLCGMVGSSIGWIQAPYVPCPARPEQIVDACVTADPGQIHIVPGLSCRNRFHAPDFMRGEETQILGALHLDGALRSGLRILCLPGTHTKWVVLEHGLVREFFTAPTGELFALLRDHSVLVHKPAGDAAAFDAHAFKEGLAHFGDAPQAQLLHRLFECRSRQLSGELAPQSADAYLSGLLIASDVHGAMSLLSESIAAAVQLIGAPQLMQLYAAALGSHGCEAIQMDGAEAALAGLTYVQRRLSQTAVVHDH